MKVNVAMRVALGVVFVTVSPAVRSATETEVIERVPVQSSTVVSVGYARRAKLLEIEFHSGAIYRYRAVPESVFAAFAMARSKGRFFGTEIRGKFTFEKLKGATK